MPGGGPGQPDPRLLGAWRLAYASSGMSGGGGGGNLLAQLLQLADGVPGFGLQPVRSRTYIARVHPRYRFSRTLFAMVCGSHVPCWHSSRGCLTLL